MQQSKRGANCLLVLCEWEMRAGNGGVEVFLSVQVRRTVRLSKVDTGSMLMNSESLDLCLNSITLPCPCYHLSTFDILPKHFSSSFCP
ncbi:hypothetical protein WR25_03899 [Diploscapter pachys]|uniref:Uncharacterized protein n=1 Tax=Diploscapter pachys TaxID=2018661 RepID=A0A2A2JMU6_9BILA|nr:hypothetical protein WR25_03899 [Diploscapter pachys]